MKKTLFLLILLGLFSTVLMAQQANPQPAPRPTGNAPIVIVDTEAIEIRVDAFAPISGIYKAKSDTFFVTGKYRFVLNDQIVQQNSEELLNKWLKESK